MGGRGSGKYPRPALEVRFWAKVRIDPEGCWEWIAMRQHQGYGRIQVNGSVKQAHRIAWELTRSKIPTGLQVLHKCDNTCCVRPDHLFLGTHMDNMRDCVEKGRRPNGVKHKGAKLTPDLVKEIRKLMSQGHTAVSLAPRFGVSDVQISNVAHRKSWRHIP